MMKANEARLSRWWEETSKFKQDQLNFAKENLPPLCKPSKVDPPSYFFKSLQDIEDSSPAA